MTQCEAMDTEHLAVAAISRANASHSTADTCTVNTDGNRKHAAIANASPGVHARYATEKGSASTTDPGRRWNRAAANATTFSIWRAKNGAAVKSGGSTTRGARTRGALVAMRVVYDILCGWGDAHAV